MPDPKAPALMAPAVRSQSVERVDAGHVRFVWESRAGKTYAQDRSPEVPGNFTGVAADLPQALIARGILLAVSRPCRARAGAGRPGRCGSGRAAQPVWPARRTTSRWPTAWRTAAGARAAAAPRTASSRRVTGCGQPPRNTCAERPRLNERDTDATVIFAPRRVLSGGTRLTRECPRTGSADDGDHRAE